MKIDDFPNDVTGWANYLNLFDWYRVCAMKITFVPSNTAISNASYRPGYVFHDPNSITIDNMSENKAISYANCKIVNTQRKWSYYRKMHRTIAVGASTAAIRQDGKGYITTDTAVATQCMGMISNQALTAVTTLGRIIITYYIGFKGQRSLPASTSSKK